MSFGCLSSGSFDDRLVDPAFLAWAAQYDAGTLEGRSRSKHEAWLAKRSCTVLRIEGDTSAEWRLTQVLGVLNITF